MTHHGAFLYTFASGVLGGIVFALLFSVGILFPLMCIAIGAVFAVAGVITKKPHIFLIFILFAAVALGVLRTNLFLEAKLQENIKSFVGPSAEVVGVVVNDPERRATSLHATVEVATINNVKAHGVVLAILERDEPVAYGDTITLLGKLELPQPFQTDTGHMFDYAAYLDAKGVSVLMSHPSVAVVKKGGWSMQKSLFDVKHYFERSIEQLLPEPDGSLLEGILLGERRGIPKELTEAFIASGLIHVVVLSGHNITIVSEGVFRALSFLPRTFNFTLGGVFMILFAAMTGFGATTVRALLMAMVALLARYLHRSALALRSLAAAAAAMALWNPTSLLHDTSFMLSILATFGLITLAPWVEQYLGRVPSYKHFDVRSILATTIAVEIFVTPALLYFSGVLSIFALPANVLALPVVPFAMLFGFIAGLLGLLAPAAGLLPALVCDLFLKWMMLVANVTHSLPHSTAIVAQFPVWVLLAVYIPLTWFAISCYQNVSRSKTN